MHTVTRSNPIHKSHRRPANKPLKASARNTFKRLSVDGQKLTPLTSDEVGMLYAAMNRSIFKGKPEHASYFAKSLAIHFQLDDEGGE